MMMGKLLIALSIAVTTALALTLTQLVVRPVKGEATWEDAVKLAEGMGGVVHLTGKLRFELRTLVVEVGGREARVRVLRVCGFKGSTPPSKLNWWNISGGCMESIPHFENGVLEFYTAEREFEAKAITLVVRVVELEPCGVKARLVVAEPLEES